MIDQLPIIVSLIFENTEHGTKITRRFQAKNHNTACMSSNVDGYVGTMQMSSVHSPV